LRKYTNASMPTTDSATWTITSSATALETVLVRTNCLTLDRSLGIVAIGLTVATRSNATFGGGGQQQQQLLAAVPTPFEFTDQLVTVSTNASPMCITISNAQILFEQQCFESNQQNIIAYLAQNVQHTVAMFDPVISFTIDMPRCTCAAGQSFDLYLNSTVIHWWCQPEQSAFVAESYGTISCNLQNDIQIALRPLSLAAAPLQVAIGSPIGGVYISSLRIEQRISTTAIGLHFDLNNGSFIGRYEPFAAAMAAATAYAPTWLTSCHASDSRVYYSLAVLDDAARRCSSSVVMLAPNAQQSLATAYVAPSSTEQQLHITAITVPDPSSTVLVLYGSQSNAVSLQVMSTALPDQLLMQDNVMHYTAGFIGLLNLPSNAPATYQQLATSFGDTTINNVCL
jgi:hypothetical protein